MFRYVCAVFLMIAPALLFISPAQAQDPASLYKSKCAVCHSADGSGSSPAGKAMKVPDLRSEAVQKQSDAQLTDTVTNGKKQMPAYKDKVSADEIKGLVGYMRGLAKK
jgi:mono/diheme cytochrome c family protein